ncbi:spore coat polysaccharide biosynthesis protein SpsF [Sporomusaceae bacterium BoRhaA]|uniref:cytidylyltransferase domain-containing protein n=1 Tax=Pelorhabdus rhamnosifermentans TaxID=2772457 RepID=UPI001C060B04|nr:NTP transferase domain-containing protein [Pelorhabdus rhamnosifermentans]MBU2699175.1 spore coat polysaccharide biosynthesis protein SpsF [Pelorhabdus rhamnosifermentans]
MKVVGTIEARMGSSRLPGKTMMTIYKQVTLLECVVTRFELCKNVDEIIVVTSTSEQDDVIESWCRQHNVNCFRGSEEDVLDRVASALIENSADVVVQMGADSAYLDYELLDKLVDVYYSGAYDYVCNDIKLTYPLGIYGHVVNAAKLISLNERGNLSREDREDVVRYIWEHPAEYSILNIEADDRLRYPGLRFTVDYLEDLEQAREVYDCLDKIDFTTDELIELYKCNPMLFAKTKNLVQRSAASIKKEEI